MHFKGADLGGPSLYLPAPTNLPDACVAIDAQKIGSLRGRDDGRLAVLQATQAGQIEMVHVCVRQQHQIDVRQLNPLERRRGQSLQTQRDGSDVQPHAIAENRIGQNGHAVHFEQDSRVAEPGGVQAEIGPLFRVRPDGSRQNRASQFAAVLLPKRGRRPVSKRPQTGYASHRGSK